MESKTRVFSVLIERLEDVLCKLQHINDKKLWTYTYLTNDTLRMHSNMKNIVNSLVNKTINGKYQWEDLACTGIASTKLAEKPIFENHINLEEYIALSMKIQNARPVINDLLNSLLSLQELLGDTLDSSCQISNYSMKLSSGIAVHDLVRLNQQYETIWQFLNSVVRIGADILPHTEEEETCALDINEKLLRSIQLCFKEITKIKLDIEHYFKVNMIELQFSDSENRSHHVLSNNNIPKADCSYFTDVQTYERNANTYENAQENKYNEMIVNNSVHPEICNLSSMTFSDSSDFQENDISSYLLSTVKHWCDLKALHNDYFNQPNIYPRDIMFLDPSAFIQSYMDNSSSVKEDLEQLKTDGVYLTEHRINSTHNQSYNNYEVMNEDSEHKRIEIDQKPGQNKHYYNDYLFGDNVIADKESNHIEGNESLVLDITEDGINNKDLFDATPLVIEKSDHSYTKTRNTYDQLNVGQNNLEREVPQFYENLTLMSGTKNCPQSQFSNRLRSLYPLKTATTEDENIIFDPDSLIEIFQANKINNNSKSGSTDNGSSSICLWPVAANYIYVSRPKTGTCLKSVSSQVSSSISENSFGNRLRPIYLNTNYQQEENYENSTEADIFTENTNTSSCSFLNNSLALFDSEKQDVSNGKMKKPILNGTYNEFSSIKNTNVKCFNGGLKQFNNNFVQKTMAVQFADCGDSFIVKNKRYTKENIRILKESSYTNNLNSFISIFTSKVGTDRQVDHRKMFRRTITSLGRRPITRDNLFNNVQTLTSNSGPYRLFDLNGYPLTDSAGNVLKDPYGKSLVDFDLTGFPKGEAKIFDAAGNTYKDVNFDPTQKPKTSTIVLKLTDNLKRPLHLFDKYGRPLTDSYGKLLVNIHGRPLLRFDNFGQPNTDYRGGPLYTENGLRWSPKNTQSKEELTNGAKNIKPLPNNSGNDFSGSFENVSPRQETSNSKNQTCTKEGSNTNNEVNFNTSSSDIWNQLEILLKNLPKKKKVDLTSSKTNVIVNNFSVLHNPLDKDLMKSIIYLDDIGEEESTNIDYKIKLNSDMDNKCNEELKTDTVRDNKTKSTSLAMKENGITQSPFLQKPSSVACLLNRDEFIISPSKCLIHDTQHCPNIKSILFNYNSGDACLSKDLPFKKGDNTNNTNAQLHFNSKNVQQHRNQHCLYNLRSEMSSYYKEHRKNFDFPLYTTMTTNGKSYSTDLSQSQLTSTGLSKYTTDMLTTSDSPMMMMIDSSPQSSSQLQKLQDYDNYLRDKHRLNFLRKKHINKHDDADSTSNYRCYQERSKNIFTKSFDQNKIDGLHLPYKNVQLSSDVLGKDNRLYELKIAEMVLQSLENDAIKQKAENETLPFKTDTAHQPESVQVNSNLEQKPMDKNLSTKNNYNEVSNDSNNQTKNYLPEQRQTTYDSLFRFKPKKEGNNVKDTIEVKYIREGSGETSSNVSMKASEMNSNESQAEHRGLHVNKISSIKQFQSKNSTRYKDYHDDVLISSNQQGKGKIDPIKNRNLGRKYEHIMEKTPTNRECNLVAFLGSPVKYFLNKLDLTRSSRPKPNTVYRLPKKTIKPNRHNPYNHGDNSQNNNQNNGTVKDSTETSNNTRLKQCIDNGQILAFRSKSCMEMCNNENTQRHMSYSGNEDNLQNMTHSGSKNASPAQTELRRYSSAICYLFEKCENVKTNHEKKNKSIMSKPKHNEPYGLKIINANHKNKNTETNHKVIKLRKAVPVLIKKHTGNHSHRQKKTMF